MRRILDLGGTDQGSDFGALVTMGYPYAFDELVIVDLPQDERHEIYTNLASSDTIQSPLGPVQYRYHSMADLSQYRDGAFDLVFSGETIEHITEDDARKMLVDVKRVLEPGGWFCVDTPNLRATELMLGPGELSNPITSSSTRHAQLTDLLRESGFEIVGAYGLGHLGDQLARGKYDDAEVARRHGVYADVENCQLLAYVCRTPYGGGVSMNQEMRASMGISNLWCSICSLHDFRWHAQPTLSETYDDALELLASSTRTISVRGSRPRRRGRSSASSSGDARIHTRSTERRILACAVATRSDRVCGPATAIEEAAAGDDGPPASSPGEETGLST